MDKPIRQEAFGDMEQHFSFPLGGRKRRRHHTELGHEDEPHYGYLNDASHASTLPNYYGWQTPNIAGLDYKSDMALNYSQPHRLDLNPVHHNRHDPVPFGGKPPHSRKSQNETPMYVRPYLEDPVWLQPDDDEMEMLYHA